MNSHGPDNLINEARLLMPWYLTGRLSEEEQELVNKALEQSGELREEFLNEEKMMRLVKENKSLLELTALDTTEQRLAKTLARIGHEEQRHNTNDTHTDIQQEKEKIPSSGWLNKLFGKGLFGMDWLSPANAVFASLLVLQISVLSYTQLSGPTDSETLYESASFKESGEAKPEQQKMVFLVEFHDDAPVGEVCDFLNNWNARIVSGPDNMNIFSVEMSAGEAVDAQNLADKITKQAAENKAPISFIGARNTN